MGERFYVAANTGSKRLIHEFTRKQHEIASGDFSVASWIKRFSPSIAANVKNLTQVRSVISGTPRWLLITLAICKSGPPS